MLRIRTISALAAVTLAGCSASDTTAPLGPSAHPELATITLGTAKASDGVMFLYAAPNDTSFRATRALPVRATITTSRGDEETVDLGPEYYLVGSAYMLTGHFDAGLDAGAPLVTFEDALQHHGAFVMEEFPNTNSAFFYAFGDLDSTMAFARTLPHARWVEPEGIAFPADLGFVPPSLSLLSGAVRTASGYPTKHDGTLSLMPGDTVTLSYQQPSGGTISTTAVAH